MKTLIVLAAASALWASEVAAASLNQSPYRVPVLLELFTSEGCSSCPPADRLLQAFDQQPVAGADLIVISEHVDYWNHLGWADPYSSPLFSKRQRTYAELLRSDDVYTPQLVVDGQKGFVGSSRGEATAAIEQAVGNPKLPIAISATRNGNRATIHIEGPAVTKGARKGDLYVFLANDRTSSQVARGENSGKLLTHVAVAYALTKIGEWETSNALDRQTKVDLKPGVTRVIAFVQDGQTGRILAVAQTKL